jgi:DNA invertase Pin-like site-specific DNA recombinase
MLTVLGALVEFERDLIRTRTGEGRARAEARGGNAATKRLPKSAAATMWAAGRFRDYDDHHIVVACFSAAATGTNQCKRSMFDLLIMLECSV